MGDGLGLGVGDGDGDGAGSFFFFFFFFFFFVTVPHLQQSVADGSEGVEDDDPDEGSTGVVVGAAVVVASYKPRKLCTLYPAYI